MADLHIKRAGSWTAIQNCKIKRAGAWTQVDTIYVKQAGSWKEVWTNAVVTLTGATIEDPDNGLATVVINTDGTTDKRDPNLLQINSGTDWIIPNSSANSSYQAKWTLVSGDTPSEVTAGWNVDTWVALSSNLTVGYSPLSGSESGVIRVHIRKGTGPTLDTGDYTITANVTP